MVNIVRTMLILRSMLTVSLDDPVTKSTNC